MTKQKQKTMTEEEYKSRLDAIDKEADIAKNNLYRQYAGDQVKFKIGDIIRDQRWTLIVEKISAYKGFGLPEPVYKGREIKKDLTPRKDGNVVAIYGNKGVELIKKNENINN